MESRIEIEFEGVGHDEIGAALPGLHLERSSPVGSVRSPEVLVALVGAGGVALGAFLKGLFDLAVAKGASKVVLKTEDGASLEAPANLSEQRFTHLLKLLHEMSLKRVQIL